MKFDRVKTALCGMALLVCGVSGATAQTLPCKKEIKQQMERVADYMLAQPWSESYLKSHPYEFGDYSWRSGAYHIGIYEAYKTTGRKDYLERLVEVGERNQWKEGPRIDFADDHAVFQYYQAVYSEKKQPDMLESVGRVMDYLLGNDGPDFYPWHWSDALFMMPPAVAQYARITKDPKYLDFMDRQWWKTVDDLYDEEYHLFYRDARFKTMEGPNGKPIFWGRGNGWVIAGLARVLEFMPENYPSRDRYIALYREFSQALLSHQQPDGFWKANLLDPERYPNGETSGTVFCCYGLAWGVNHGILDKNETMPAIEKAWSALGGAIHPDGKLGFVQSGGDRPNQTSYDATEWYGVGGFLLAGSEVVKRAPRRCK